MKQMIPLKKQSKKAQKKQHAKQRGSWYGICPIIRTVPNGKAYDRNRIKREDREYLSGAAIQSDHSNPDRLLQEVPKDLHAFRWEYAQR